MDVPVKKRRVVPIVVSCALIAAVLGLTQPAGAHSGTCVYDDGLVLGQLNSGQTLTWTTFSDSNSNGVADGFLASDDFNQSHCGRNVSPDNEVQRSTLYDETSNSNCCSPGDLSIYRYHTASGGQTYTAGANMNLWSYGGDFRGVVKMIAQTSPGVCYKTSNGCWEQIAKICVSSAYDICDQYDGADYKPISVSATLPSGNDVNGKSVSSISFLFRGRAAQADAFGTAGMEKVFYCRKSPPC